MWGSFNKTHIKNLEKLHARAGRIVYGLPLDTSAEDVLTRTGWASLETMYKVRLTEFLFKCIKGYTVAECKDLFFTQVAQAHHRNADVTLACERCYKRLFTKACMGWKRFSLKERKNVMFLNKIDLPYGLVSILCCLPASQAVLKRFRRVSAILVFPLKIALTRGKRFKTAWDADKQQRIQTRP